jgi:hypothetical protein
MHLNNSEGIIGNTLSSDRPINETQGGNLHEGQGGLSGLSPFRSDGSQDSQVGRLDCVSSGQGQSKSKLSLLGANQARFHSDQMVPVKARQKAGLR